MKKFYFLLLLLSLLPAAKMLAVNVSYPPSQGSGTGGGGGGGSQSFSNVLSIGNDAGNQAISNLLFIYSTAQPFLIRATGGIQLDGSSNGIDVEGNKILNLTPGVGPNDAVTVSQLGAGPAGLSIFFSNNPSATAYSNNLTAWILALSNNCNGCIANIGEGNYWITNQNVLIPMYTNHDVTVQIQPGATIHADITNTVGGAGIFLECYACTNFHFIGPGKFAPGGIVYRTDASYPTNKGFAGIDFVNCSNVWVQGIHFQQENWVGKTFSDEEFISENNDVGVYVRGNAFGWLNVGFTNRAGTFIAGFLNGPDWPQVFLYNDFYGSTNLFGSAFNDAGVPPTNSVFRGNRIVAPEANVSWLTATTNWMYFSKLSGAENYALLIPGSSYATNLPSQTDQAFDTQSDPQYWSDTNGITQPTYVGTNGASFLPLPSNPTNTAIVSSYGVRGLGINPLNLVGGLAGNVAERIGGVGIQGTNFVTVFDTSSNTNESNPFIQGQRGQIFWFIATNATLANPLNLQLNSGQINGVSYVNSTNVMANAYEQLFFINVGILGAERWAAFDNFQVPGVGAYLLDTRLTNTAVTGAGSSVTNSGINKDISPLLTSLVSKTGSFTETNQNVTFGQAFTNNWGSRAFYYFTVQFTDSVTGRPIARWQQTTTGILPMDYSAPGAISSTWTNTVGPFSMSPSELGTISDVSAGSGASVSLVNMFIWILK